jgi:hypothetical protein
MQTVVRHVVCFKYKSTATPEDIEKINQAFANLKNEMPFIIGIEMGPNISPEGLSKGFTHCYVVTFKDRQGRDEYLPHPAHKALVEKLGPILEEAFVVDYESVPVCCCNCQCGKQCAECMKCATCAKCAKCAKCPKK